MHLEDKLKTSFIRKDAGLLESSATLARKMIVEVVPIFKEGFFVVLVQPELTFLSEILMN